MFFNTSKIWSTIIGGAIHENLVHFWGYDIRKVRDVNETSNSLHVSFPFLNHCIRETYFILFDNIEPRSLEKLGDLGLRQLIGKESWEKLKHLDDISMSQSIKKGPRL